MYAVEKFNPVAIGGHSKLCGPGVKSEERKAIEALTPGTMVRIPRDAVKESSFSAWATVVGREKGHRIRTTRTPDHWVAYVE